jgi:hypothetical protein
LKKAKAAKSAEELLEIAKANGVGMTEEEAKTYFAQLCPPSGEIDDDDLDNVAGGACGKGNIRVCVSAWSADDARNFAQGKRAIKCTIFAFGSSLY